LTITFYTIHPVPEPAENVTVYEAAFVTVVTAVGALFEQLP
jgi:hypothetical protein